MTGAQACAVGSPCDARSDVGSGCFRRAVGASSFRPRGERACHDRPRTSRIELRPSAGPDRAMP
eukprot:13335248-Alexandrium_andersonii.AAC.1